MLKLCIVIMIEPIRLEIIYEFIINSFQLADWD